MTVPGPAPTTAAAVPLASLTATGPDLSAIVWGVWRSVGHPATDTADKLARVIELCVEQGITSFDHADIYGGYRAETAFAEALRLTSVPRDRIQLVSKCDICLVSPARPEHRVHHYDTSAAHIRRSVDRSLENLRTDHLDLLLIHRPDPLMDAAETAQALDTLVTQGRIKAVGVSNHTPSQLELLRSRLKAPLVTNQVECSVLHTQPILDGTLDQAQRLGFRPMIWSPQGGGRLFRPRDEEAGRLSSVLDEVGARIGLDRGQTALAWLATLPSRPIPVIGTSEPERIRACAATASVRLERQDWFEIYEASRGVPIP